MLIHSDSVRRDYRARGWWGDDCVHHLVARNAQQTAEREAVVDPPNLAEITGLAPQRVHWLAFATLVERLACGLIRNGLVKDDVVVAQMANSHVLLAVYIACARLGIIVSPIVPQYREHELLHVLRQTQARALVVDARIGKYDHAAMAQRLRAQVPGLQKLFVNGWRADHADAIDLQAIAAKAPDMTLLAAYDSVYSVSADDIFCILWTSGSEGHAKGVPRTHNEWLQYRHDMASIDAGVDDGARLLNGRPLTTHGAFYGSIVPWLVHAGTLINHHPFTLDLFLHQLSSEDIHFTALAPAIMAMLLAQPALLQGLHSERLRCVGSGSAPLNGTLLRDFESTFGVQVINFFGSTEGAVLASTAKDVQDPVARARCFPRFGASGKTWKHPASRMVQTRLVDLDTGADILTSGKAGEMRYRGPTVMTGYWREPALTSAAFDEQGYYKSGDLFEIVGENDSYYAFTGRAKDIIIRGGFNISAVEIEELVAAHPAVAQVAVVGYPDARMGEKVCACVVLRHGSTLDLPILVAWLRDDRLVGVVKLPERLLIVETLPRSANNKVLKATLRERAIRLSAPLAPSN